MSSELTVTKKIHFSMANKGRREIRPGPAPVVDVPDGRVSPLGSLGILGGLGLRIFDWGGCGGRDGRLGFVTALPRPTKSLGALYSDDLFGLNVNAIPTAMGILLRYADTGDIAADLDGVDAIDLNFLADVKVRTCLNPGGELPTSAHIADVAAATQGTYTASTTLTDPPTKAEAEAELALIDAELDKIKVDIAANKTTVDALLAALEGLGLLAAS